MRKRTPHKNKKRLFITLGAMALGALFGYIETLIPAVLGSMSFAKVQLSLLFVLFVTVCYSPAEGGLAWGARCLVNGLCIKDGNCMLIELAAGVAALCAFYYVLRTGKVGLLFLSPLYALCYSIVYCVGYSIAMSNAYIFYQCAPYAAFVLVNSLPWFVAVYIAVRYLPIRWLQDEEDPYPCE